MHVPGHGPGVALSAVSGDVVFILGMTMGNELLAGAAELDLSQSELVGILMLLNALFVALPTWLAAARKLGPSRPPESHSDRRQGLAEFVALAGALGRRLTIATLSQVLAQTVSTGVPMRSVRVVTLCSTAVFWVFLGAVLATGRRDALIREQDHERKAT